MTDKPASIRYRRLDDLVKFVSMTPQPFLSHVELKGKHVYFFVLPFSGSVVVAFFASEKRVEGEYVTINRMTGKFAPTNRPTFDAQSLDIPILEVDSTDLLDSVSV